MAQHKMKQILCTALQLGSLSLASLGTAFAAPPQQEEIESLRQRLEETERRLDALADAAVTSPNASSPLESFHLGSYGELHYNNLENDATGATKEEIDFHRFVVFLGYDFTDWVRFRSEIELEHAIAGDDQNGEVELEQAYLEFDLNERTQAKGGLFLVPVGILNETHEPPTFYGVERNPVEREIIPTTWWEGGGALSGSFGAGWGYDVALHSGLNSDNFNIRSGRQKVSEADASDPAVTGRLRWSGIPGVSWAVSTQYQRDITQGGGPETPAVLVETHVALNRGPLGLRALYARWDLDSAEAEAVGRDKQYGWYLEPSWRIGPQWGVFARYSEWDTEAGGSGDSTFDQTDVGMNFWPIPQVVLKADYQWQNGPEGRGGLDGFNLGIGYQF
ncbi:MAG TPA: hypothetical protein VNK45_07920 [Candidatus Acidoferrales bacterium]|nr:hypothetical protein [Candidatus Acidoferrales bacterium]